MYTVSSVLPLGLKSLIYLLSGPLQINSADPWPVDPQKRFSSTVRRPAAPALTSRARHRANLVPSSLRPQLVPARVAMAWPTVATQRCCPGGQQTTGLPIRATIQAWPISCPLSPFKKDQLERKWQIWRTGDQIAKQNNVQTCALRTALPRKGCTDTEMVALPHRTFGLTSEVTENINDSVKYFQKPSGKHRNALWPAGLV